MNILFVHEVDWLNKVVFDVHSLSEYLSLLGHRVFAIDYENTWQRDGLNLGSLRTKEFDGISRALPGASVCLRRPGFIKIPGLSRMSAAFTHYQEIKKTIRDRNIDVIMLYSVPTNGLQTMYLARKFHIPVLFRSMDTLNQLVPIPALQQPTKLLERKVYSKVDMILTLTPRLSQYAINLGAEESRVRVLPFPVDTNLFHPGIDCSKIRHKWGIADSEQVILYMGTLFDFSGLDGFIRLFPQILEQVPRAKLLVVGDGPQRTKLEELITKLELGEKVIITGLQPYETMPQYINLASICLLPFLITDATRDIFPGKIAQYLACARAVISTPLPGLVALISGEGQGVVYVSSADEMLKQVVSLLKTSERRRNLERAGLNYAKQVHSCEKIAHQLELSLEETIKEKRDGTTSKRI